jgi:hypothetical protein
MPRSSVSIQSAPFETDLSDSREDFLATFENFYAVNVAYDLTRQWITQPGPFSYDYRWLSSAAEEADMKNFGARHFEKIYGVNPDTIEIL